MFLTIANSLQTSAEVAVTFLRNEYGISRVNAEKPIEDVPNYVPTIWGRSTDWYYVCIDVAETLVSNARMQFAEECISNGFPVKLYVAIEKENEYTGLKSDLLRLRDKGIGMIEISPSTRTARILQTSVGFSLVGLRLSNKKDFPAKYRERVLEAEQTYLNGNPNKGVADVMDSIENLTRQIAQRAVALSLWRGTPPSEKQILKDSWAQLLKKMESDLKRQPPGPCRDLTDPLISRVRGLTDQRNQSSHLPKNRTELVERDKRLRTRMEHAADIFLELTKAAKPLRI